MPTMRGFALAIAVCAGIGVAGGWALWGRAPDRAEVALALLEGRCAPRVLEGEPFDATGLDRASSPLGELRVEPRSLMAVSPGATDCTVTDALAPFSEAERARFVAGAEALGLRLLPGSRATTPDGGATWAVFRVIAAEPRATADRFLTVARLVADDDSWIGQTVATLRRVRDAGTQVRG